MTFNFSQNLDTKEMENSINFTVKYFVKYLESEVDSEKELFNESVKYLKITCTKGTLFQNIIMNAENFLESLKTSLENEKPNVNKLKSLQLLANLCVNNPENQNKLWMTMKDVLIENYEKGDEKTIEVTGMIIYNTILGKSCSVDERNVATISLQHYEKYLENTDNTFPDFSQILLEHFICNCKWIVEYFKKLEPANQINLLYFVNDHIENESNK